MIYPTITLWQPYASLVAIGAKPFETRAYPPPRKYIGQRIAIHAAARRCPIDDLPPDIGEPIRDALGHAAWNARLPFGAIVCTATLAGAYECGRPQGPRSVGVAAARGDPDQLRHISIKTDPFGDYSPGSWAWLLTEVQPLPEPVPAKGKQGWWKWDGEMTDMPWNSPDLAAWSICGMNHYHVAGKRHLFVSMVRDGLCITAEGADENDVFSRLAADARQQDDGRAAP